MADSKKPRTGPAPRLTRVPLTGTGRKAAHRQVGDAVTPEQYRRAEAGIGPMLGTKFSGAWIARHGAEVLSRAHAEYVEWLADNPPADNPVGWILNCAYWRAQNLYDSERRKPATAPLDSIYHLADESEPDPEELAVENDRRRVLADALGRLPEKERKLLAYVYYGDLSIREAGRRLGWAKSAADRHHKAAMEKMLALVGDRKLLSTTLLGPAAQATVTGDGHRALHQLAESVLLPVRRLAASVTEAVELAASRVADLGRRIAPFGDAGNAMATNGAGRVVAQCGAAAGIAACSFLAGPAVEKGVESVLPDRPARDAAPAPRPRTPDATKPAPRVPTRHAPPVVVPEEVAPQPSSSKPATEAKKHARQERRRGRSQKRREARAAEAPPPPPAPGQAESEFGVTPEGSEPESPSATEAAPAAPPPPAGQGGEPTGREFGL